MDGHMNVIIDPLSKIGNAKIGAFTLIGPYVYIEDGSVIWHYCNIYGRKDAPVRIGKNTQIGSYTQIKPDVQIGDDCRLQDNLSIPNGVTLEDYVFVAPGVVFTNDKHPNIITTLNGSWNM